MIVKEQCHLVQVALEGQMYKVIDYKQVDLSDLEFDYYNHLVKIFSDDNNSGSIYFKDLFEVDDDGLITIIKTEKSVPWAILFFVQQVMINQRLRVSEDIKSTLNKIDKRLIKLENELSKIKNGSNHEQ